MFIAAVQPKMTAEACGWRGIVIRTDSDPIEQARRHLLDLSVLKD